MSAIDHKAEAILAMTMAGRDVSRNFEVTTGETKADILALGLLHATLFAAEQTAELVKQQRIANMQVERGLLYEKAGRLYGIAAFDASDQADALDTQISEGLGL